MNQRERDTTEPEPAGSATTVEAPATKGTPLVAARRRLVLLGVIWSAIIVGSLAWNLRVVWREALAQARGEARAALEKDLVYRAWTAGHGGVYAPIGEDTPPNPYLSHLAERDITTPAGRELTLINPAYMTRQVHVLAEKRFGVRGHITSLNPIRAANAPDPWEQQALEAFEQGETEVDSVEKIDGQPFMRLMQAMPTEQGCLKCHAAQGYKVGQVRGGISVSVPLARNRASAMSHALPLGGGHALLWLVGILGIGGAGRSIMRQERERLRVDSRYHDFVTSSVAAVWFYEVQPPMPLDLPVSEQPGYLYDACVLVEGNDALAQQYGFGRFDEIVGWRLRDIMGGDREAAIKEVFVPWVENGYCYDGAETHEQTRSGEHKHFYNYGKSVFENGHLVRVWGTQIDITERKRAAEEARQRAGELATILSTTTDGYVVLDDTARVLDANETYCQMTGYDLEELRQLRSYGLLVASSEDAAQHIGWLKTEGHDLFETQHRAKDGGVFPVEVSCSYWPDQNRILAFVRDISERRRVEDTLRANEERYRSLSDAAFEGICVQAEGRIVDANVALLRMLGYEREDLIGQPVSICIAPDTMAEVKGMIESGNDELYQSKAVRKDGSVFHVETQAQTTTQDGRQVRITAIRDISDRREAEAEREKLREQLAQAHKMEAIGRLAGGVAHDFNNQLQAILGYTDMLLAEGDPAAPGREDLLEVKRAARRSADLTQQLLAFARKQTVSPVVLDLNETTAGMLKMLRRLIGEDIDLLWKPTPDVGLVRMDPSQVDQILANLVVNARDAIAGVGTITIETGPGAFDEEYCADHPEAAPGQYVMLAVSDDGAGMDEDTMANIFEPFFTTKGQSEGTGLGLATVYGIVKQNAGFVNVYSEPGEGTTFRIYLPREMDNQEAIDDPEPVAPQSGAETVLLVEDDTALLKLAHQILSRLGYTVLAANGPEQALAIATEHDGDIHLLLTDVVMPKMNGRDLFAKLDELRPGLRCLFMSGYTADIIADRGVLDSGVDFIPKPFPRNQLARKVREVLDRE